METQQHTEAVPITIQVIDHTSPYLARVKELWRAHSGTLGFFPDGAFTDHAIRKRILVAIASPSKHCIGYLLYRISGNRAIIVHLCVDPAWRRKGIAHKLVDHLSALTRDLQGIALKCRRDYAAALTWPSMNFVAQHDTPGRSFDGKELTLWWRDHQHPNLFSQLHEQDALTHVPVVIDMNILIDFYQDTSAYAESKCLLADWLSEIELCTTSEIYNEIERIDDQEHRQVIRGLAQTFKQITAPLTKVSRLQEELRPLFPTQLTINDESDIRHLAIVIGANVQYLVTRDDELLRLADEVYERYQTQIVRPAQLIMHFDELLRENVYQPVRLAGTPIVRQRVAQEAIETLIHAFQNSGNNESPAQFRDLVRRYCADPRKYECVNIQNQDQPPLALLVTHHPDAYTCEIPLFRVANNAMQATLARYLAFSCIERAANQSCHRVWITDPALPTAVCAILGEEGFHAGPQGWVKLTWRKCTSHTRLCEDIRAVLHDIAQEYTGLHTLPGILMTLDSDRDISALLACERLLWPAKIMDANIPTYIIPIRPVWAQHLFDESLAHQNLFGADTELALRRECVFYRAKRPTGGLIAPARVFWYVSKDDNYAGSGAIRACSYIDDIIIDTPKSLYRQFRRLGAYEWKQLVETVRGEYDKKLMAIRFRDTELLPIPIPWGRELKAIVPHHAQFQSPVRITPAMFSTLYQWAIAQEG